MCNVCMKFEVCNCKFKVTLRSLKCPRDPIYGLLKNLLSPGVVALISNSDRAEISSEIILIVFLYVPKIKALSRHLTSI